ncbi:hypothetical protein GCM10011313_29000 [Mycetocola zhadangensis]|nr:hypothetical protein GCM10011313_29000 [Mycetocola zhadangensis]
MHDGTWLELWNHRDQAQQAYYQAHPERFRQRPSTPSPAALVGINNVPENDKHTNKRLQTA